MLNKKLILSTAVLSALLTGCGGGGSGSDDHYTLESKNSLANGTRYYYMHSLYTTKIDNSLK